MIASSFSNRVAPRRDQDVERRRIRYPPCSPRLHTISSATLTPPRGTRASQGPPSTRTNMFPLTTSPTGPPAAEIANVRPVWGLFSCGDCAMEGFCSPRGGGKLSRRESHRVLETITTWHVIYFSFVAVLISNF